MRLVEIGYPAEDLAGYTQGDELPIQLRSETGTGKHFRPRDYQRLAAEVYYADGAATVDRV